MLRRRSAQGRKKTRLLCRADSEAGKRETETEREERQIQRERERERERERNTHTEGGGETFRVRQLKSTYPPAFTQFTPSLISASLRSM
jgi:hypothetical protein